MRRSIFLSALALLAAACSSDPVSPRRGIDGAPAPLHGIGTSPTAPIERGIDTSPTAPIRGIGTSPITALP